MVRCNYRTFVHASQIEIDEQREFKMIRNYQGSYFSPAWVFPRVEWNKD